MNAHGIQPCDNLILEVSPAVVGRCCEGALVGTFVDINLKQKNFKCVSGEFFKLLLH